jgi:hypothetical protein
MAGADHEIQACGAGPYGNFGGRALAVGIDGVEVGISAVPAGAPPGNLL